MTRRDRSGRFDEDRTSDALCNTSKRQRGGVAASILLGCTPQCLGATSNSDRALGADPSTRCRSASVTGLAPSPQRPWGCEKSSDAVRNLRARAGGARPKFFRRNVSPFVPYFLADAISNTVNVSRWEKHQAHRRGRLTTSKAVVPYDGSHRNPRIGPRNDDTRATPT